ncbi:MAG: ABC transporter permease, partial [Candidatus Micrarchaeia archaeon]
MFGVGNFVALFWLALDSITHRKTRSFLTMLGIFIGVASVVALIALGQGLSESINSEFAKIGVDKLSVSPGGGSFGSMYTSKKLTDRDFDAVKRVAGVERAGYMITQSERVQHGGKTVFAQVHGISTASEDAGAIEDFRSIEVDKGRLLNSNDKYKVLVGAKFNADNVYGSEIKLNDVVVINSTAFRVVGMLKKVGDPSIDGAFIIPGDAAKEMVSASGYNMFVVQLAKGLIPSEERPTIEKALRQSRGVSKGHEDFKVSTSEQLLESFNTIFNVVQVI